MDMEIYILQIIIKTNLLKLIQLIKKRSFNDTLILLFLCGYFIFIGRYMHSFQNYYITLNII